MPPLRIGSGSFANQLACSRGDGVEFLIWVGGGGYVEIVCCAVLDEVAGGWWDLFFCGSVVPADEERRGEDSLAVGKGFGVADCFGGFWRPPFDLWVMD